MAPGIQTDDKTFVFTIVQSKARQPHSKSLTNTGISRLIVAVPAAIAALDPASADVSVAKSLIISFESGCGTDYGRYPDSGINPAVASW